jgi:hypothetical protein
VGGTAPPTYRGEPGRRRELGDQLIDADEVLADLLDAPGQVVLEVLELHLHAGGVGVDLHQILERQHLVFVAVQQQDVEIGVQDALAVGVGHTERNRLDAVALVDLALEVLVLARVGEVDGDRPAGRHGVFGEGVLDLGGRGGARSGCVRSLNSPRMRSGSSSLAQRPRR